MPSRGCLARRGAGKSATTKETFQSQLEEKEKLPRGVVSSLFHRQRKRNQSEFFKKWLSNERIFLGATYTVCCWAFEIGRSGLAFWAGIMQERGEIEAAARLSGVEDELGGKTSH